jgi:putative membrane protein
MTRIALLAATALVTAMPAMAQTPQQRAQAAQGQTGQPGAPARSGAPAAGLSATGNRAEVTTTPEFIRMASMSDRFEIASGNLAQERSRTARVKEFAQHMVRDHEKTTQELQTLVAAMPGQAGAAAAPRDGGPALAQGEPHPGGLDQQHQARLQQLEGAQGAIFERLYLRQQVMAHMQAVDLFRNYAASGDNAALKQWAAATLPTLQEHLRQAQQLQSGT